MKKARVLIVFMVLLLLFAGCSKKEAAVKTDTVAKDTGEPEIIEEYISILTVGDNLLHMPVVNSGRQDDGTYEYSHIFENLQPRFKDADISVIGQETVFGGADFGYSGYPLFNSPSDMGKTIYNEGFDVVLHASNHALDKWAKGVENTLEFWKEYPEILVLGINESHEEKNKVDIMEVKGAKLAMLNYTYGTNGFLPPSGKEYLVNYIDEEKIASDVAFAEENADFTVCFLHWGIEYSTAPVPSQTELAKKMCEWGVDLVVGAHPHVIEPVEWVTSDNGNRMLVYYSLGNFVSRQLEAKNLLGGIANVTLKYDGNEVKIHDYEFEPIVTHYDVTHTKFTVYPLSEYTDELASVHGVASHNGAVSVERWKNILRDVFYGYDTSSIKSIEMNFSENEN